MAYVLEALICRGSEDWPETVSLPRVLLEPSPPLVLVPLTNEVLRSIASLYPRARGGAILGFLNLTEAVENLASDLSVHGAVAYVHAEFFGGTGFQAAVAWQDRRIVFGPRFTANHPAGAEADYYEVVPPSDDMAINEVLMRIGVKRALRTDEVDTLKLGDRRSTEDWMRDVRY
jgi:hypothetical protein